MQLPIERRLKLRLNKFKSDIVVPTGFKSSKRPIGSLALASPTGLQEGASLTAPSAHTHTHTPGCRPIRTPHPPSVAIVVACDRLCRPPSPTSPAASNTLFRQLHSCRALAAGRTSVLAPVLPWPASPVGHPHSCSPSDSFSNSYRRLPSPGWASSWSPKMMCATNADDVLFELSELTNTRTIGEGTSAVVYAGLWRGLEVAVKVLRGGLCERASAEAARERNMNTRLRHPNIVPLLGLAGAPGGAHALVFEFCSGGALDPRKLGWDRSALEVLDIALDIARALEHAHARGVLHRDVKPTQVLLGCCGRARLADWGLAAEEGSAECGVGETGTWEYMAPEIVACTGPYGFPADVFSFGVLLWTLCAGASYPYETDFLLPEQAALAVARGDLRPRRLKRMADAPPRVQLLLDACWAHDPRDRPPMRAVVDELLAIRDTVETHSPPPPRAPWPAWLWGS